MSDAATLIEALAKLLWPIGVFGALATLFIGLALAVRRSADKAAQEEMSNLARTIAEKESELSSLRQMIDSLTTARHVSPPWLKVAEPTIVESALPEIE